MNCNEFQSWLSGFQPARSQDIPGPARDHGKECAHCARSLEETVRYQELLSERRPARQDESFWDNYLQTVMKRATSKDMRPQTGIWYRRMKWALVPTAAAILFATILLYDREEFTSSQPQDEVYAATYDVIWEEHNRALSGYIFDPTSLYFVEDLVPENWENGTVPEQ